MPAPVRNGLEVGSIGIPLEEPFLAPSTLPKELLPFVDLHQRRFQGVSLQPLICREARTIS